MLTEMQKKLNEITKVESWDGILERQRKRVDYNSIRLLPFTYNCNWSVEHIAREIKQGEKYKRYPHVILKDGETIPLVGFYASYKHSLNDRITFMKYGKFINKFYPDKFDNKTIAQWSNDYAEEFGASVLHFARTGKDIVRVYENGPNSCMGKKRMQLQTSSDSASDPTIVQLWSKAYAGRRTRFFDLDDKGDLHPCMVYANWDEPLDLSVAYCVSANNPKKIVARAVAWESRKTYSTVYGSSSNSDYRLNPLLNALGFEQSANFQGARLRRVEFNNQFIMPYLDLGDNMRRACYDNGNYLIIDSSEGTIDCDTINGLGACNRNPCHCCDDDAGPDYYLDHLSNRICHNCMSDSYFCCEGCDEYHHDSSNYSNTDNGIYCESCSSEYLKECFYCNESHHTNGMGSFNLERICHNCITEKSLIFTGFRTRKLGRAIYVNRINGENE